MDRKQACLREIDVDGPALAVAPKGMGAQLNLGVEFLPCWFSGWTKAAAQLRRANALGLNDATASALHLDAPERKEARSAVSVAPVVSG